METLLQAIKDIPGKKLVRLVAVGIGGYDIKVSNDGRVGDGPETEAMFLVNLAQAADVGAALTVRQYRVGVVEVGGRMFQRKNLYGVLLQRGGWRGMSAREIREILYTDYQTGEFTPPEPGVTFCDFPNTGEARNP